MYICTLYSVLSQISVEQVIQATPLSLSQYSWAILACSVSVSQRERI